MADIVNQFAVEVMRHVPMITWVGLSMSAVLGCVWIGKRQRDCALLACVCAAYAATPYLPYL